MFVLKLKVHPSRVCPIDSILLYTPTLTGIVFHDAATAAAPFWDNPRLLSIYDYIYIYIHTVVNRYAQRVAKTICGRRLMFTKGGSRGGRSVGMCCLMSIWCYGVGPDRPATQEVIARIVRLPLSVCTWESEGLPPMCNAISMHVSCRASANLERRRSI